MRICTLSLSIHGAGRWSCAFSQEIGARWRLSITACSRAVLTASALAHGWPGRSLVGEQGAMDAWLLAQHADRQPGFQRRALSLLAMAVEM